MKFGGYFEESYSESSLNNGVFSKDFLGILPDISIGVVPVQPHSEESSFVHQVST